MRSKVTYIAEAALALLFYLGKVDSFCKKLENETWDELVGFLDEAQAVPFGGFVMFCPFVIRGPKKCPPPTTDGYVIHSFDLEVYCAYWHGKSGAACVIDCPMHKNHFVIEANAYVTMDSFTTMGARESSILVKPFGYYKAVASIYEKNGYEDGEDNTPGVTSSPGGSAILVSRFGSADLELCVFKNNRAANGGAVRNMGEAIFLGGFFENNVGETGGAINNDGILTINQVLFQKNKALPSTGSAPGGGKGGAVFTKNDVVMGSSTFEKNYASDEGGALYSLGTSELQSNLWKLNSAGGFGPAIAGTGIDSSRSEGCGNVVQSDASGCDGIFDKDTGTCYQFEHICSLPTTAPTAPIVTSSFPTSRSSEFPSSLPSLSSNPTESSVPSAFPRSLPSGGPSRSPSLRPSRNLATSRPTSRPSSSPSLRPSLKPEQ